MSQRTFQNHVVERGVDLLLDPRLPHAAPYNLWRQWRYARLQNFPHLEEPVRICLTFDVEHDYRNPASSGSAERFMDTYGERARARGWRGTLYVQGSLTPILAERIRELAAVHEIGLHGLHHEVWGRSRWWQYGLGFVGLSGADKRQRLQIALELFDAAQIKRPISFRAPYLNADRQTLKLLAQNGFTSDSSPATYLGIPPVPLRRDGIWQIPVTANPRPVLGRSIVLHHELSLGVMLRMSKVEIRETVSMALYLQRQKGSELPPHVVLLAHPWEFEPTPGVPHASDSNWECLASIVSTITDMYRVIFTTMTELTGQQRVHVHAGAARTQVQEVS